MALGAVRCAIRTALPRALSSAAVAAPTGPKPKIPISSLIANLLVAPGVIQFSQP